MKTKPQNAQNNNEAAKQQDGPIYGPPTEKEHWQSVRPAAYKKRTELAAQHEANLAKLPVKPAAWTAFEAWLKENHPALMEGYEAISNDNKILLAEERKHYRKSQMLPLYEGWAATDPTGVEYTQWHDSKTAIDEAHNKALEPIGQSIIEATRKLENIAQDERRKARDAAFEKRMREEREAKVEELRAEIGIELCREINPDHPDFDKEAFETFVNAPGFLDDTDILLNYLLFGPTGGGKTRTMAHWALQVEAWNDVAWITAARFADLVAALGKPARSNEAHGELRRLAEVQFLFFDDVGSVKFNEARLSRFYALLNTRYTNNRVTFFSTNYNRSGLLRVFAPEGDAADHEIAERIVRRMIGTPAEPRANLIEFKRHKRAATAKGGKAAPVC